MPKNPRQRVHKLRSCDTRGKFIRFPLDAELDDDEQLHNFYNINEPQIRARKVSFEDKSFSKKRNMTSANSIRRTRSCLVSLVSEENDDEDKMSTNASSCSSCLFLPAPLNETRNDSSLSSLWGQFIDVVPPDETIHECPTPYSNYKCSRMSPLAFSPYRLDNKYMSNRSRRHKMSDHEYNKSRYRMNRKSSQTTVETSLRDLKKALNHLQI